MRISLNERIKVIQFWLTHDDMKNENLYNEIDILYNVYCPDSKYKKIIYQSGIKDVTESTINLFKNNIK